MRKVGNMAHDNSPSSIMYADFKNFGLKNRDVALVLLDADRSFGDTTLRDRIESRTQLSRSFVHVAPGEVSEGLFNDFAQSSQTLMSRIASKMKERRETEVTRSIGEHYAGPAAQEMQAALRAYGIDDSMYRNTVNHISKLGMVNEADRSLLYLMLFVATGCTGDPRKAANAVEDFSSSRVGASYRTTEAVVDDFQDDVDDDDFELGLMRIVGGKLKGTSGFYKISPTEQGTEIGALASEPGSITDVDEDVSRHHARIYKSGRSYYIIGLKSTNGTTVISGDDKQEHVVEPPKRERPRDYVPKPYEIFPTDTICLGASTRFMAMPFMGE